MKATWELRGDLFGGEQFSPGTDYVIEMRAAPALQLHDRHTLGALCGWWCRGQCHGHQRAGLVHTCEFNLQAATEVRWFVSDHVALGVEERYLHLSCAGMNTPNLGLNNVGGSLTVTWFF